MVKNKTQRHISIIYCGASSINCANKAPYNYVPAARNGGRFCSPRYSFTSRSQNQQQARSARREIRGVDVAAHPGRCRLKYNTVAQWSEFSLFAVAGDRYQKIQRENRHVPPSCKVAVTGGFQRFCGNQRGGHFLPPGVKSGVSFSSALTVAAILAGPGGDMCKDLR